MSAVWGSNAGLTFRWPGCAPGRGKVLLCSQSHALVPWQGLAACRGRGCDHGLPSSRDGSGFLDWSLHVSGALADDLPPCKTRWSSRGEICAWSSLLLLLVSLFCMPGHLGCVNHVLPHLVLLLLLYIVFPLFVTLFSC